MAQPPSLPSSPDTANQSDSWWATVGSYHAREKLQSHRAAKAFVSSPFEMFPALNHWAFLSLPPRFGARALSFVAGSWCLSINPAWARATECRWWFMTPACPAYWGPSKTPSTTPGLWCQSPEPGAAQCPGQQRRQQSQRTELSHGPAKVRSILAVLHVDPASGSPNL